MLYANGKVTVKPLFGQWYHFLTIVNTEMKKQIYLSTYTQWTIEDACCNKVSLKRSLRKLKLFRYVTGSYNPRSFVSYREISINGNQLAKFVHELLIGRTSSIYLGVRLKV